MPAKDETIAGLTHRIARAIDFAIYKNVDAINLSFGWPESANNEIIELAIKIPLMLESHRRSRWK